jgi:hypothetical protein
VGTGNLTTSPERRKMEKYKEEKMKIVEDLNYLFSKINWGDSFLDARAVSIMNEISHRIGKIGEEKC